MRLTNEELQKVMQKYNVDRLYSWSKINCFMTSKYEYYLKYLAHIKEDIDNCAYAPMGGICHQIIEDYYNDKIDYDKMIEDFLDGWTTAIEIADLKFDRNDESKNANIRKKYKYNLEHFFKTHKTLKNNGSLSLESFIATRIGDSVLQGYIDAVYKDKNGFYNIIDWKTSTKYSGKTAEEKCGQLVVYAIGLSQQGIPMDKIRICWNFLKYVSIQYEQANGAIKTREVERSKIGESLQTNAKMWLKKCGYGDQVDDYLKELIDTNGIECLPEEVQKKYVVSDCYVYVPLTDELINRWKEDIITTINDIELREADYNETQSDKTFWDTDESVEAQSYYFSTLCGYSPNLHLPYKAYLERMEKAKDGDVFSGVGSPTVETNSVDVTNKVIHDKEPENVDLSWLDNI